MKARIENANIKIYKSLPKEFRLSDGTVSLTFDKSTAEILESEGFYNVIIPNFNKDIKYLGDIEFNDGVFTYPVIDKTWSETLSELKSNKIVELKNIYNKKLSSTDWYITRSQEGISVPQEVLDIRTSLREECQNKENEINALTTKKSVASYSLPIYVI